MPQQNPELRTLRSAPTRSSHTAAGGALIPPPALFLYPAASCRAGGEAEEAKGRGTVPMGEGFSSSTSSQAALPWGRALSGPTKRSLSAGSAVWQAKKCSAGKEKGIWVCGALSQPGKCQAGCSKVPRRRRECEPRAAHRHRTFWGTASCQRPGLQPHGQQAGMSQGVHS